MEIRSGKLSLYFSKCNLMLSKPKPKKQKKKKIKKKIKTNKMHLKKIPYISGNGTF